MTEPRYVIAKDVDVVRVEVELPSVPVGTSIRLEFTEDGWVDRGALERPESTFERFSTVDEDSGERWVGLRPRYDLWADAPSTPVLPSSTETTE